MLPVRITLLGFLLLAGGSVVLASGEIVTGLELFFMLTVIATSLGVYALRGLYFAIMKEGPIPLATTGSAVGFVSLIGFTPDVFMRPLMGWLLDRLPSAAGHQDVFVVVAGFAPLGIVASLLYRRATVSDTNMDWRFKRPIIEPLRPATGLRKNA